MSRRRFQFIVHVDVDGAEVPDEEVIVERSLRVLLAGHAHGLNEPLPVAPDRFGDVPAGLSLWLVGLAETRPW